MSVNERVETTGRVSARAQKRRAIRLVAVPSEHGGWGFVLEPVLLGLLVEASVAGVWLGVAMLGAFLARQPLKLALADRRQGKRYPRTMWAERFAGLYALVGGIALLLAALTANSQAFCWAILAAVPLAVLQGFYDSQRQSRQIAAELAGATAMGAGVAAIALAGGGWEIAPAFALWVMLAARSVPSIVYVRLRLRLERGEALDTTPSLVLNVAAVALVGVLAFAGLVPWLAAAAMMLLAARAVWGLSPLRRPVRAPVIGASEIVYGLVTVLLTAVGVWWGL
jgi:hypothetical protein